MRKTLLFLLLTLLGAATVPMSARWDLAGIKSASALKAGDSVVIEPALNASDLGRYITGTQLSNTGTISDEAVFIVEQGPLDIRTNAPTFYFKRVTDDNYISGSSGTITYTADIANATNFQVISCGEDIPWSTGYAWDQYQYGVLREGLTGDYIANWANPNNTAGPKVATDESVGLAYSTSETDWTYLALYGGPCYMGYTDINQWNLYGVHFVSDYSGDLEALINQYAEEGEYTGGTDPGFYEQSQADAYQAAMESALQTQASGQSDEEFITAINNLKAAHAAIQGATIPISEGYYYVVSGFDDYMNNFGIEKAVYANTNAKMVSYKTFDPQKPEFVWHFTPGDTSEEWWMQSYLTDYYVGNPTDWYNCNAPIAYDRVEPQNFRLRVTGKFFWGSRTNHGASYCTDKGVVASDNEGNIISWAEWNSPGTVEHHFNLWYLRKITDQSLLDSFAEQKAQAALNSTLNSLVDEATTLYGNLFTYRPDTINPLITVAGGGIDAAPIEGNQITFSSIRKQGVDFSDNYKYLIDNIDSTYMQGEGSIYFDISKNPQQTITFAYNSRCASGKYGNANQHLWGMNERPNRVQIFVTNDTTNANSWTQVASADMGELPLPAQITFDCGAPYSFVRVDVISNHLGSSYFTVSETQLYKTVYDEASSQYYTTTGMKEAADKMFSVLEAKRAIVARDSATQADVDEMQAAINAVRALYADTTELASLISECETLLENASVGDELGQVSSQELVDNLRAAINDARANAFGSPIKVAAIQAATAQLTTARAAYIAGIKTVEPNKWYFITNADTERQGEAGTDDARCTGSAIYLDNKYAGGSVTKWGLVDPASGQLNANNNPKAMWRFVLVDSVNNYYAIQNMYSGYYLGNFAGAGINLPVSETPVPYNLLMKGSNRFELIPTTSQNRNNYSLWPEGAANDVICHEGGSAASVWSLIEIDPEEQMAISIGDFGMNTLDIMALPYNFSDLAELNDDQVHTYAIKKITQELNADSQLVSTIEFYEKNEFKAGEPCLVVLGDTASSTSVEGYDIVIPFPTEIVDHSYNFVSNGIVGGLHGFHVDPGTAISTGKKFVAVGGTGSSFDAQTGIIDPTKYTGEVPDVETAYTITVTGMSAIPSGNKADVNGDGQINSADIAVVYNYIANGEGSGYNLSAIDVNGDGVANASDVASIYAQIVGESASSKAFAKILKMLK